MHITSLKFSDHTQFEDIELTDLKDVIFIIGKNGSGKTRLIRYIHALTSIEKVVGNFSVGFTVNSERGAIKKFSFDESQINTNRIINQKMSECAEKVIFLEIPTILQTNVIANLQATEEEIQNRKQKIKGKFDIGLMNNLLGKAVVGYLTARSNAIENEISSKRIKSNIPTLEERLNKALTIIIPELQIKEPTAKSLELRCIIRNQEIEPQFLSSGEFILLILALEILSHNITKGIIFIDEIEAHLHPDLQAKLVYFLRALFEPYQDDIQIWITTNSPVLLDPSSLIKVNYSILNTFITIPNRISIKLIPQETIDFPKRFFQLLGASPFYSRKKLLYVEGPTEKDILNNLFNRQGTLSGLWRIEPLNGCKAVIKALELSQHLINGPAKDLIPELSLIHGLIDNNDQRVRPSAPSIDVLYQWPFYHIENLLFCAPWKQYYIDSLSGTTGKNQSEIESELNNSIQEIIKGQKSKSEGSQGRVLSDTTISNLITNNLNSQMALPGRIIFIKWRKSLGLTQKGGVDPKDLIIKYINQYNLEIPKELQNFIKWLQQK